ncbi:MAG: diaminopimelate epimerase, partial [Pseudomonadota bacterium]
GHGTLTLSPSGTFSYTPTPDFNGVDLFTYAANDGVRSSAAATVTVRVTPVNDAPLAVEDRVTLTRVAPVRLNVVANDLDVDGQTVPVSVLSMGNPHAVQMVPDVDAAPVNTQGPKIERHPRFPKRVNAGYMQIVDRRHVRLRVYERGAGETLACGSGACAAVVAGRQRGLLDDTVKVTLPGGTLTVSWAGDGKPVRLAGPAVAVFEGTLDLDGL